MTIIQTSHRIFLSENIVDNAKHQISTIIPFDQYLLIQNVKNMAKRYYSAYFVIEVINTKTKKMEQQTDKDFIYEYVGGIQRSLNLNNLITEPMIQLKELVLETRKNNGKLFFAGNGASETISAHAALDYNNQLAVKAMSINNSSILTCFANDFGYEDVFSRYLKINAQESDVAILISSSGNSSNVIKAAQTAKEMGMKVVTLTGFEKNNKLKHVGDINFWLDSKIYNVVETIHMIWLVTVCDLIAGQEKELIGVHGKNI